MGSDKDRTEVGFSAPEQVKQHPGTELIYTKEECEKLVKTNCSEANGVTWQKQDFAYPKVTWTCFAEFNAEHIIEQKRCKKKEYACLGCLFNIGQFLLYFLFYFFYNVLKLI